MLRGFNVSAIVDHETFWPGQRVRATIGTVLLKRGLIYRVKKVSHIAIWVDLSEYLPGYGLADYPHKYFRPEEF
jgi:hypothetical protein